MSSYFEELQLQVDAASGFVFLMARFFGMYPFVNHNRRQRIQIRAFKVLWTLLLLQLTITVYHVRNKTLLEIVDKMTNLSIAIICGNKYIIFIKNMQVYKDILDTLRHTLWMNLIEKDHVINMKYINYLRIATYLFAVITVCTSPVYLALPTSILVVRHLHNENIKEVFPFGAWYPFDSEKYHTYVYIYECFIQIFVNSVYGICDLIVIIVILFFCMHLTRLQVRFKAITENLERTMTSENYVHNPGEQKEISKEVDMFVRFHIILIETFGKLNDILSSTLTSTYTLCSITLCSTCFVFIAQKDFDKILRALLIFVSLLAMLGIQCFCGQQLINESNNLAKATYFSKWYLTDVKTQKKLHFILMRCQKPLKLVGNKMILVEMTTFSSIVSSSYTYFTLLRRMYND